jgi:NAD(P)-dependent dehydrogenase (short-subunit alcohol dehydrogenase family)
VLIDKEMSCPQSLFSLNGKTAVIIGGTGELCGAMAEGLAGAGAEVVLAGRNREKADAKLAAIKASGGDGYFVTTDVAGRESIENLLSTVIEKSGKCEILVNGAGINSPTPFLEVTEEEFDRILSTNTKAVFVSCQVFGSYFLENRLSASIINVGSMSGMIPLSRVFTYSMSKAAVHNISKNLAREWASSGIRVNTLVPGFFPAEQNRKVLNEERVAAIMAHTPMQRFGEAKELIGATLLLASEQAGGFITGSEIVVDGGYASMTI